MSTCKHGAGFCSSSDRNWILSVPASVTKRLYPERKKSPVPQEKEKKKMRRVVNPFTHTRVTRTRACEKIRAHVYSWILLRVDAHAWKLAYWRHAVICNPGINTRVLQLHTWQNMKTRIWVRTYETHVTRSLIMNRILVHEYSLILSKKKYRRFRCCS